MIHRTENSNKLYKCNQMVAEALFYHLKTACPLTPQSICFDVVEIYINDMYN